MSGPKPSKFRVRFVAPGARVATRKRRRTEAEIGLRAHLSQFYSMKAVLERLFGRPAFLKVKDGGGFTAWRKATHRLLNALDLAIRETVAVADPEWRTEMSATLDHGRVLVRHADTMAELFAALSATLTHVAFLQIGMMPSRSTHADTIPLRPDYWRLTAFRTVQYVQDDDQKQALAAVLERRRQTAAKRHAPPP